MKTPIRIFALVWVVLGFSGLATDFLPALGVMATGAFLFTLTNPKINAPHPIKFDHAGVRTKQVNL